MLSTSLKEKNAQEKEEKTELPVHGFFSAKKLGFFDQLLIWPEKATSGISVILNNREYSVNWAGW